METVTTQSNRPIQVRLATAEDLHFVCASWFESNWKINLNHTMSYGDYRDGMNRRITKLLSNSKALVAYATVVPDEVVGYAIVDETKLHYTYVKSVYRRQGVASALLSVGVQSYTHTPGHIAKLMFDKMHLKYNPFLLE